MPRLLDSSDKACAKLQELVEKKDQDQVANAADFKSDDDSVNDLKVGFEAGLKAAKGKGNAYIFEFGDGAGVIFIGKAEDIRKKLEKLDDEYIDEDDDDSDDEEEEDEDEEEEDEELPDA